MRTEGKASLEVDAGLTRFDDLLDHHEVLVKVLFKLLLEESGLVYC